MLVRRYDERLRNLALRLVAEPDRIDAVLKRAYLRAWRSLASVQVPGSVSEWLYRVVYNACINELRWAPEAEPPPPVDGPRVPLPAASAKRRIAGLRALPPEERVPLVLIDAEGFTLDAAARILQKPPTVVASDLARARGRWRALVVGEPVRRSAPEVVELEPDEVAEAEAESAPRERPRHVRVLSSDTPPSPKRRPFRPRAVPTHRTGHTADGDPASSSAPSAGGANAGLGASTGARAGVPAEWPSSVDSVLDDGGSVELVDPGASNRSLDGESSPAESGDEVVSAKGKRRKAP